MWEDRDGNIWAGTNGGLARLEGDRFVDPARRRPIPGPGALPLRRPRRRLWVGANSGLTRLRDDVFTVYGKSEGLPSDEPNAVFQDHTGRIWVGFHDGGLMLFSPARQSRSSPPATACPATRSSPSARRATAIC